MAENSTRSKKDTARLVAGIILLVLLVLFAATNADKTRIDFLVADVDVPLILVLLVAAVLGAAVWELFRFRRSRR